MAAFKRLQDFEQPAHSLFIVLRPRYAQGQGKVFYRAKGLEINDTAILFRGQGRSFKPDKYRPLILSASYPAISRRGGTGRSFYLDTTLFKVAEIMAYNRFFSKQERRQMDAYLSLKYSIPTTKNEDPSLRSYPGDSAHTYYWSPRRDKIYDREVIALGNFPFSSLMQSQTIAYHDDSLIIALDSIVSYGQMPSRFLGENAFLIMSKRLDQSSVYNCERHLNQQFPITAWRMRTSDFQTNADSLVLRYPNHQGSSIKDTLILTDGRDTIYPQVNFQQQDLRLSLGLGALKPNRVYRFRLKSNACDDTSSMGLLPLSPGMMALQVDPEMLPLKIGVQDLHTNTYQDTLMQQNPLWLKAGMGQYLVLVEDSSGRLKADFMMAGLDSLASGVQFIPRGLTGKETELDRGQQIVLYPNPAYSGEWAYLEFRNFPIGTFLQIDIYDPQGRRVHQGQSLLKSKEHKWRYRPGLPGVYTIVIRDQEQAFQQKLTVIKRF